MWSSLHYQILPILQPSPLLFIQHTFYYCNYSSATPVPQLSLPLHSLWSIHRQKFSSGWIQWFNFSRLVYKQMGDGKNKISWCENIAALWIHVQTPNEQLGLFQCPLPYPRKLAFSSVQDGLFCIFFLQTFHSLSSMHIHWGNEVLAQMVTLMPPPLGLHV